jgi:predicted HTH transcriptional regulator
MPPTFDDQDELRAAILEGEGRQVEFKRGLPSDAKVARSLCAFANTRGGLLFIGVGDRGELEGAPHPEEAARKLVEIARRRILPPIEPRIAVTSIDGVRVVVARVAASRSRPHAVLHEHEPAEVVVRSGSSNRVASRQTLAALKNGRGSRSKLDAFEKSVLEFVESHATKDPNGGATVAEFARGRNVGVQRARRAFTRLEREGFLIGVGLGQGRRYHAA